MNAPHTMCKVMSQHKSRRQSHNQHTPSTQNAQKKVNVITIDKTQHKPNSTNTSNTVANTTVTLFNAQRAKNTSKNRILNGERVALVRVFQDPTKR